MAPAVPWFWDSVGSASLGVSFLSPSFQGLYLGQLLLGLGRLFPQDWDWMFCLGSGLSLLYGVCGREGCWMIFREETEVLDMTWSLMALLRSEILQANSSYSGAFKCFFEGERLGNINF